MNVGIIQCDHDRLLGSTWRWLLVRTQLVYRGKKLPVCAALSGVPGLREMIRMVHETGR